MYWREIGADDFRAGSTISAMLNLLICCVLWKLIREIDSLSLVNSIRLNSDDTHPYARPSSKVKTPFRIFQRRYIKTSIQKQATDMMREVEPVLFCIIVRQEILSLAITVVSSPIFILVASY